MNSFVRLGFLAFAHLLAAFLSGCTSNDTTDGMDNLSVSGTEIDTQTATQTESVSATATETEAGTDSESVTQTESVSATATETEAGTDSESVTETESVSATATETEAGTDSESVTETESVSATATETEAGTDSESVTETESVSATASETDSWTATSTDSESATATDTDPDSDSSTDGMGKYCYYEDEQQTLFRCLDHGETCEDPEVLPTEGTYVFSNAPFLDDYTWMGAPMGCVPSEKGGQDLVYALDVPAMKKLSARVDGISFEGIDFLPKLFVSTSCDEVVGSCVAGQSAAFEDVRAEYSNRSDGAIRLYLVVDSDFGDTGLFSLDVKFSELDAVNGIGDSCSEAATLTLPALGDSYTMNFSHELLAETPSADHVCDSTGRDGFFAFTVDAPSTVKLDTLTSISSKHIVFLYQDGCAAENAAGFTSLPLGAQPVKTNCGVSKYSSALGGYLTRIAIEAEPGHTYVYGVQLFAETTATSEFELTVTVE
ncbi:MAG: MSCRAMM family adhesin SdrC [Myxococcota bacterium]|nr:MSCRAMM family adhesin SdrC [Myxococcota bacterium]